MVKQGQFCYKLAIFGYFQGFKRALPLDIHGGDWISSLLDIHPGLRVINRAKIAKIFIFGQKSSNQPTLSICGSQKKIVEAQWLWGICYLYPQLPISSLRAKSLGRPRRRQRIYIFPPLFHYLPYYENLNKTSNFLQN